MESLLVSACLLGFECKYSGGSNKLPEAELSALRARYRLIPVCPESAGGLPTPRPPSEIRGQSVVSCEGRDVTAEYIKGAETALYLSRRYGCKKALLKEKSPSCGSGVIYDGSFTGSLTEGYGVAAASLKAESVELYGETQLYMLIS